MNIPKIARYLCMAVLWVAANNDSLRAEGANPLLKFRGSNVVFISFDALQAAHVGAFGYPRKVTPTIDSLALRSCVFSQARSVSSWTVPASMTWFTGVYPSEHRMVNKFSLYQPPMRIPANLKELSPQLITLAEILRQNGYVTGGFTGNAGVSGGFGYEQGFDVYYFEKGRFGSFDQSIPRALKWLDANRDKKFFLFLHGYDVHGQCSPATGFDYRFVPDNYDKRYTGSELEQETLREEGLENGHVSMRPQDVQFWRAIYDEKIQRADEKFKHFLAALDNLGRRDNLLLIVTSDHGTELYEHRRFDHGFTLYDELLHVPLIIQLPGQTTIKKITAPISSIDLMPTILDLLDVNVSDAAQKQLRGKSLVSTIQGKPTQRDIISETDYRQYTFKRSIITPGGWKLIYTLEHRTRELYNLKNDPTETMNLANTEPNKADELQKKLFDHFRQIGHDLHERSWQTGLNPVYDSQAKQPERK